MILIIFLNSSINITKLPSLGGLIVNKNIIHGIAAADDQLALNLNCFRSADHTSTPKVFSMMLIIASQALY
jgi:hypothetical protein